MAVWMVRAGKHGEQEEVSLEQGYTCLAFNNVGDLSHAKDRSQVFEIVEQSYVDASEGALRSFAAQLNAFSNLMKHGDIVALPLKSQPQVALGRIRGDYEFRPNGDPAFHVRKVEWVRPDLPRTQIAQDMLYSLGAIQTVCQISRNDAESRFEQMINGKADPALDKQIVTVPSEKDEEADEPVIDIAQLARDEVRAYIEVNFKGHSLARLVDAVLRAEGYSTYVSPPGPDQGVDVLARRGSLGLEGPKLCVQVKSSVSPSDVNVFRALQGTMSTFKADEGLLVSWGGFTRAVRQEARLSFFSVRLWDSDSLIDAIERLYDKLPDELQAELPLKRVWTLVLEGGAE